MSEDKPTNVFNFTGPAVVFGCVVVIIGLAWSPWCDSECDARKAVDDARKEAHEIHLAEIEDRARIRREQREQEELDNTTCGQLLAYMFAENGRTNDDVHLSLAHRNLLRDKCGAGD